jgi:hypothetical protein
MPGHQLEPLTESVAMRTDGTRAAAPPASRPLMPGAFSPDLELGRCGFGRGELAVDDARDRQQLRLVDPA